MNIQEEGNQFLTHKPVHLYPNLIKMFFYIQQNPKLKYIILSTLSIFSICHILLTMHFLQKGIQDFPFQSSSYQFNEDEYDFYKEYREECFLPILLLLSELAFISVISIIFTIIFIRTFGSSFWHLRALIRNFSLILFYCLAFLIFYDLGTLFEDIDFEKLNWAQIIYERYFTSITILTTIGWISITIYYLLFSDKDIIFWLCDSISFLSFIILFILQITQTIHINWHILFFPLYLQLSIFLFCRILNLLCLNLNQKNLMIQNIFSIIGGAILQSFLVSKALEYNGFDNKYSKLFNSSIFWIGILFIIIGKFDSFNRFFYLICLKNFLKESKYILNPVKRVNTDFAKKHLYSKGLYELINTKNS